MTRIVIFANGELNQPDRLKAQIHPTDRIFCADGGTLYALALGFTPEKIIGDLDSLPNNVVEDMENAHVTIHRHPTNKDFTDLELALELALAENPDEILLVTVLGGRLDQMLANILLLTRLNIKRANTRITLVDSLQRATLLYNNQCLTLTGKPGDTVSLIPLTLQVTDVTLNGVKWPLTHATLTLGSTLSISNQMSSRQATVQIGQGMALVVYIESTNQHIIESAKN